MNHPSSSKELVVKLREGDKSSFTQLYNTFEGKLYNYVLSIVKSPEIADDVVQEVFIKIWEQRETVDPDKSFQAFIFAVSRNHVINLMRRSSLDASIRKEIFLQAERQVDYIDESVSFKETEILIQEALNSLPMQQKRIFELCKISGLTYEEAAAQLNITSGTVNGQIVKSLKAVRRYLHSHGRLITSFLFLFLMFR